MRRSFLLGTLFSLLSLAAPRNTAALDKLLRSSVDNHRVPGVVAAVATRDGVVYEKAVGFDKSTIFAIASMTKPVTSVAVMQLVEAGKVRLDEPAKTYLPELTRVQVLENGRLRDPKTAPTVRQLLTHTSGFVYEFSNRELHDYAEQGKVPRMAPGSDAYLKAPLLFDPGSRWEYGISTDWLGRLIEKVSGENLEVYFREHIFDPLKMPDTFFNVPREKQSRVAETSVRNADGTLAAQPRRPLNPTGFFSGGGGLYSTAADYITFGRALMGGGHLGAARILKEETVAEMLRNQIDTLPLTPVGSVMPQLVKDRAVLPGGPDKFGLGFAVNTKRTDSGRGPNTGAWAGIFNTFFWIDRENQVCAVLLTQMLPFGDDGPLELMKQFDRAVYAGLR